MSKAKAKSAKFLESTSDENTESSAAPNGMEQAQDILKKRRAEGFSNRDATIEDIMDVLDILAGNAPATPPSDA